MSPVDSMTIAVALGGAALAKTVSADGTIQDYDRARLFDLYECPIDGLAGLLPRLRGLALAPSYAVLRGAIADRARTRGVRRLLHDDTATGDKATLVDVPRRWFATDHDSLPLPAGVDPRDLPACGQAARATLPTEFHDAACIVQATSSHGIKPGIRVRLWWLGGRPTWSAELKTWLRTAPVDHSIYNAAQLIYTASPIFIGRADHLPDRLAVLPGREAVLVPEAAALRPPPPPSPPPIPRFTHEADRNEYAAGLLAHAAAQVASAPPGQRHNALLRAAARLARFRHAGILADAAARAALARAAQESGLESAETENAIAWGFSRPDENPFRFQGQHTDA